jgi:hypothetical protein
MLPLADWGFVAAAIVVILISRLIARRHPRKP